MQKKEKKGKKIYTLDVADTLRGMQIGEHIEFVTSGKNMECSYNTLYSTAKRLQGEYIVSDNQLENKTTVTRI